MNHKIDKRRGFYSFEYRVISAYLSEFIFIGLKKGNWDKSITIPNKKKLQVSQIS